jgi:hypothetical protein
MMIALPLLIWHPFAQMPVAAFAESLKAWATQVNLKRCSCSPRGPKELAKKEPLIRSIPMLLLLGSSSKRRTDVHLNGGSLLVLEALLLLLQVHRPVTLSVLASVFPQPIQYQSQILWLSALAVSSGWSEKRA